MGTNKIIKKTFNRKKLKNYISKKSKIGAVKRANPFDHHYRNNISQKISIDKNASHLINLYKSKNRLNSWKQSNLDSNNVIGRLVKEKQKQSKKALYNLNENDQTFDFKVSDFNTLENINQLEYDEHNSDIVSDLHFGGFENNNSKKSFYHDMISASKKLKSEKQREKENLLISTEELDQTWKNLRTLVKESTANNALAIPSKSISKESIKNKEIDSYDLIFRDLQFNFVKMDKPILDKGVPNIKDAKVEKKTKQSLKKTNQPTLFSADALSLNKQLCDEGDANTEYKEKNELGLAENKFVLAYNIKGDLIDKSGLFKEAVEEPTISDCADYITSNTFDFLYNLNFLSAGLLPNERGHNFYETFKHFPLDITNVEVNETAELKIDHFINNYLNPSNLQSITLKTNDSDESKQKPPVTHSSKISQNLCDNFLSLVKYFTDLITFKISCNIFTNHAENVDLDCTDNIDRAFEQINRHIYTSWMEKFPNVLYDIVRQMITYLAVRLNLLNHLESVKSAIKSQIKCHRKKISVSPGISDEAISFMECLCNVRPVIFTLILFEIIKDLKASRDSKFPGKNCKLQDVTLKKMWSQQEYLIDSCLIILMQYIRKNPKSESEKELLSLNYCSVNAFTIYYLCLQLINYGLSLHSDKNMYRLNCVTPSFYDCFSSINRLVVSSIKSDQRLANIGALDNKIHVTCSSASFVKSTLNIDLKNFGHFFQCYLDTLEAWLVRIEAYLTYAREINRPTLIVCLYPFLKLGSSILENLKEDVLPYTLQSPKLSEFQEKITLNIGLLSNVCHTISTYIGEYGSLIGSTSTSKSQNLVHIISDIMKLANHLKTPDFTLSQSADKPKVKMPQLLEPLIFGDSTNPSGRRGKNKNLKLRQLTYDLEKLDRQISVQKSTTNPKKQGLPHQRGKDAKLEMERLQRESIAKTMEHRQMVKHVIKRDLKTARKEIRKDASLLAQHKLQETMQKDRERKDKVKRLYSLLATQEGEVKAIKRGKVDPDL